MQPSPAKRKTIQTHIVQICGVRRRGPNPSRLSRELQTKTKTWWSLTFPETSLFWLCAGSTLRQLFFQLSDSLITQLSIWLRTQRGSAVRTPRAAEPEGEREVWRERVQGRFAHAWRRPRARARARARAPSPSPNVHFWSFRSLLRGLSIFR